MLFKRRKTTDSSHLAESLQWIPQQQLSILLEKKKTESKRLITIGDLTDELHSGEKWKDYHKISYKPQHYKN